MTEQGVHDAMRAQDGMSLAWSDAQQAISDKIEAEARVAALAQDLRILAARMMGHGIGADPFVAKETLMAHDLKPITSDEWRELFPGNALTQEAKP